MTLWSEIFHLKQNISVGSIAKKANSLSIPLTSLKFPPVTSLSFSSTRSKDWDDVLTAHHQETFARTWTVREKKVGKWHLNFEPEKGKAKDKKKKRVIVPGAVQVRISINKLIFDVDLSNSSVSA